MIYGLPLGREKGKRERRREGVRRERERRERGREGEKERRKEDDNKI